MRIYRATYKDRDGANPQSILRITTKDKSKIANHKSQI